MLQLSNIFQGEFTEYVANHLKNDANSDEPEPKNSYRFEQQVTPNNAVDAGISGSLITVEAPQTGNMKWSVYAYYTKAAGVGLSVLAALIFIISTGWLH